MFRVDKYIFYKLNEDYHRVKYKNNLYCVVANTRNTIFEFIESYLLHTNLKKIYYREYDTTDIYEEFLKYFIEKKPNILDTGYKRIRGSFSGCLQRFLNRRLNPLANRTNPKVKKYQPEFVPIQNCWRELLKIEADSIKYANLDEVVDNELDRIYKNNDYLCGNYLDYNSALFVAMFLGIFDVEYKESLIYFPYTPKEYMINALACKFTDLAHRVERRV